jgi:glycerol uptake facilitator-like aquaporin
MRLVTQRRRLVAEAVGTALLVAAVIGSGIMAQQLTGDRAVALLANTIATGGALVAILLVGGFILAQAVGATLGALLFTWLVPLQNRDVLATE